ncbi:MAG: hypothetical protein AB1403_00675 [Candidatus Riflebacteria bacterium]
MKYEFTPEYRQEFMEMCQLHTRKLNKIYGEHKANGTLDEFKKIKMQMREELTQKFIALRQKYGIPADYEE